MILWDILAPLHGQNTKGAVQSPDTTHSEYTLDTRLRVRTQYTHPLTENHAAAPAVVTDSFAEDVAVTGTQMGELAELSIDDLLTQLPEQDFFYPGYYQSTM